MKRVIGLLSVLSVMVLSAHATIIDYDADPGAGYQFYFPSGANLRALDDVNRVSTLPIKEIRIVFANLNTFSVNATLHVHTAVAGGAVGPQIFTATATGIPANSVVRIIFPTPNIAAGIQNLWIGLSTNAATNAGMVLTPNPPGFPNPGTSQDLFAWDQNGNGTIDSNEYFFFGGNPPANFAIEVYAIPEPASLIALGSGLVGLLALRRRRRA